MKTFLLFITANMLVFIAQAQNCPYYSLYIQKGDKFMAMPNPQFDSAINAYSAAMLHCPEMAWEAGKKINSVFAKIQAIKNRAEESEKQIKEIRNLLQAFYDEKSKEQDTQLNTDNRNISSSTWGIVLSVDTNKAEADFEVKKMQKLLQKHKVEIKEEKAKFYTIIQVSSSDQNKLLKEVLLLTKRPVWLKRF